MRKTNGGVEAVKMTNSSKENDKEERPVVKNTNGGGEEPDFYWENGLIVFTKAYHLKRGYCCKSGCRHCPYDFKKEDSKDKL